MAANASDERGFDRTLAIIAEMVNTATDTGDMAICDEALALADKMEKRGPPAEHAAVLDYFRANAWACRYEQRRGNREQIWDWNQPEIQQQIFLLRRALNSSAFAHLQPMYRCQILTNLGNQFNKVGRVVEAQAVWTRAIGIDPNFWMARANRGNGLMHYAGALYDHRHQSVLALKAHGDLTDAVDLIAGHPDLGEAVLATPFAAHASQIAQSFDLQSIERAYNPDCGDLGDEPQERSYRRWCLDEGLFLNPLNDVGTGSIAARDILGLPSFRLPIDEPPIIIGMANELKQGFASARWLLWEGLNSEGEAHCSDRGSLLYNTLDYPVYGLAVEKVKLAFRVAYSTFDKIAYFLNHYLGLGIPEMRVAFRTIWKEKENGPVRDVFLTSENLPWRGLFWLGKDLFDEEMRETTEPEARALAELRNHLEHKYVKVHEMGPPRARSGDPFWDTLAYAIGRTDLERKTVKLMQLARAALIYLFLGMHRHETTRGRDDAALSMPMPLDEWEDSWKM